VAEELRVDDARGHGARQVGVHPELYEQTGGKAAQVLGAENRHR
jgi:hypothetical protein